ncbi:MAG TPA: BatA and WFA domain-containing protein [Gemmatimonadaceae bacterium]|nr:BatA and WFA domain-containing protein [Gemmatimonadaceae bacterium]
MSLLSPWLLLGLGALAIPVLVHLMHRERKDVVFFPSLMFLERIPYQAVRRQRIRHWLLLVLRCLAVVLLVLAFARPFLARAGASAVAGSGRARDIVILLDRSYSMDYGDRWARAVAAARHVVTGMSGGDRAAVVYFAGTASAASPLTGDKAVLVSAIDSVHPTAGTTRYGAALRLAGQILGDTARPRREVVLISDAQRTGWAGRRMPRLSAGATLTQIDVGDSATADVAITGVDVRHDAGGDRAQVVVAARLANRSADSVARRAVTLEVNGRQVQTRSVGLSANGTATVTFDAMRIPAGASRGVVRTGADALRRDNAWYFTLGRARSLPVLLVESPDAPKAEDLYISHALDIGDRPSFRVSEVRTTGLNAAALRDAALLILNDAPLPHGEAGRRLLAFVKGGGGLLVVLGGRSRPDDWPASASELLPHPSAPIDRLADHGAMLGFLDRSHPVFEPFDAPRSGDFSAARFFRYWNMSPGAADRQLARFDDGHVALLERRVGAGRVLVLTSALDGVWNDLPVQPVFLPLLQQAATYAAAYTPDRPWVTVGEAVRTDSSAGPAVAITPSGAHRRLGRGRGGATLEFAEQGFYEIRQSGGAHDSTRTVAVNVDLAESDLTRLDSQLFATAVAPSGGPRAHADALAQLTPADLERRQSVWWYLLVAALLLMGAETVVANRLSRTAR